jgi:diaminohydroxyphosphoribosylaminopyrimidine deaminase/5-amino-6-(5-phosphoribosylamino)uracil reductase
MVKGKDPVCVVLSRDGEIPNDAKIFKKERRVIIAATKQAMMEKAEVLVTKEKDGLIDLPLLLKELGKREITSILVEGGRKVITSFLKERLVDRAIFFISPKIVGEGKLSLCENLPFSIRLSDLKIKRIEDDIMVSCRPVYTNG